LRASVRIGDLLGRYGGDEFVAVCEELRDRAQATGIAARIVRDAAAPIVVGDAMVEVTASVGIALARRPSDESPESVIGRADQAMYLAKQHGNAYVLAPDVPEHHAV
jgi:diguanylate cyclase (GGDEF)-like protein